MEKAIQKKRQNQKHQHAAVEKARAVLSVWTERRKPVEICRELQIQWNILQMWQKRAMEGMLQALEPRVNLKKGPALSSKLQQMLEKREKRLPVSVIPENRLEEKLMKVQASRSEKKPEKPAKKK